MSGEQLSPLGDSDYRKIAEEIAREMKKPPDERLPSSEQSTLLGDSDYEEIAEEMAEEMKDVEADQEVSAQASSFPRETQKRIHRDIRPGGFQVEAPVQIFLSYAREDEEKVEKLYHKLSDAGFKPWMDKKDILPGERWQSSIRQAIRGSDFFLACLSDNSVNRRGFLQREIEDALDICQEMLYSDIYLIPARLEDCEVPERLRDFQPVDLFGKDSWTRLLKAIRAGIERRLEVPVDEGPSPGTEMATPEEGPERVQPDERVKKPVVLHLSDLQFGPHHAFEEAQARLSQTSFRADESIRQLEAISPGRKDARLYEKCVFEILCFLFEPELTEPELQSETGDRVQIRDIVFFNDSTHRFWTMVRQEHNARNIVFELKNTRSINNRHIDQLSGYLTSTLGRFGVLVTRAKPPPSVIKKARLLYNSDRKVILILSDSDLIAMIKHKAFQDKDPINTLRKKYVRFTRDTQ